MSSLKYMYLFFVFFQDILCKLFAIKAKTGKGMKMCLFLETNKRILTAQIHCSL